MALTKMNVGEHLDGARSYNAAISVADVKFAVTMGLGSARLMINLVPGDEDNGGDDVSDINDLRTHH